MDISQTEQCDKSVKINQVKTHLIITTVTREEIYLAMIETTISEFVLCQASSDELSSLFKIAWPKPQAIAANSHQLVKASDTDAPKKQFDTFH